MPAPVSLVPMRKLIFPDQQQDRSNRYWYRPLKASFLRVLLSWLEMRNWR